MKKYYILLAALFISVTLNAQIVNIPDANFKNALVNTICADFDFSGSNRGDVDTNDDGEIQVSEAEAVFYLDVRNQSISSLEGIEYFTSLVLLQCGNNELTTLDLSNTIVMDLSAYNNQLTYINIKNGAYTLDNENFFNVLGNPDFLVVCRDSEDYLQAPINTIMTTYCSFTPGGDYNTVQGQTSFDNNGDGCNAVDLILPHLVYTISDGSSSGSVISNDLGEYAFYLGESSYTFSPVLENPSYFTINPESQTVSFPADTNPFTQDFCVIPNGVFNDLEITIIPTNHARPGFDSNYKVLYKNKGNTTLSGNINFGFEDDVMTFISSTPPNESGVPDLLQWPFTDLLPFESREINLTMNLNAPTDTPPLNDGDILTFNTSIASSETDETPDDNMFELNQTVVNSFDPNDKTCLEGAFITPEMVGEYVHYMIRFENTGSAEAVNIVVKDYIDISTYDLSTLVPLNASHDFFAKIKDTAPQHYVEFIFEDINLPFDDANNDGYIAFKIKTHNSLQLGDTFENNARIYFDYNFPIITNVAQTTVATLSVDEFELANSNVSLYPNPTTNLLHIDAQQNIQHVSIYDVSSRLIKNIAIIGEKTSLDISTESLASGSYFVKIESENRTLVRKVVKD